MCTNIQLTFIGEGASRRVYYIKNAPIVVKMAKNSIRPNKNEVAFWKSVYGTADSEYFVPVLWWDDSYEWIVMPKVSLVERVDSERLRVPLRYSKYNGITSKDFGMLNGICRCFDYHTCVK